MCNSFNVKCNWKRPKKTKIHFVIRGQYLWLLCLVLEYTINPVSMCRNRRWLRVDKLSVNHMMTRVVVIESLERGEPGNKTGRVWSHCDHQVVTTAEICCHQWDLRSSKIASVAIKYYYLTAMYVPRWQLVSCSVTTPFLSAKDVACETGSQFNIVQKPKIGNCRRKEIIVSFTVILSLPINPPWKVGWPEQQCKFIWPDCCIAAMIVNGGQTEEHGYLIWLTQNTCECKWRTPELTLVVCTQ